VPSVAEGPALLPDPSQASGVRLAACGRLTTAADLANGGMPAVAASPDAFRQGMLVLHPDYGLGRIVALGGSGTSRHATVDFSSSAGRQSLILRDAPLRPVGKET